MSPQCKNCGTSEKLYVCQRHKVYACYSCLEGVKHLDGQNVEGVSQSKFVFKCQDEDCNFFKAY